MHYQLVLFIERTLFGESHLSTTNRGVYAYLLGSCVFHFTSFISKLYFILFFHIQIILYFILSYPNYIIFYFTLITWPDAKENSIRWGLSSFDHFCFLTIRKIEVLYVSWRMCASAKRHLVQQCNSWRMCASTKRHLVQQCNSWRMCASAKRHLVQQCNSWRMCASAKRHLVQQCNSWRMCASTKRHLVQQCNSWRICASTKRHLVQQCNSWRMCASTKRHLVQQCNYVVFHRSGAATVIDFGKVLLTCIK